MTQDEPTMADRLRWMLLAMPLLTASCAGLDRNDRGLLQPQTVTGPCQVKKFFIMNFTANQTDMAVTGTGEACTITIFNPDLQIVTTAALVTSLPAHGQAVASLVYAGRQAAAAYTPQPGYTGPDHFTITLEPNDRAVAVSVMVRQAG